MIKNNIGFYFQDGDCVRLDATIDAVFLGYVGSDYEKYLCKLKIGDKILYAARYRVTPSFKTINNSSMKE